MSLSSSNEPSKRKRERTTSIVVPGRFGSFRRARTACFQAVRSGAVWQPWPKARWHGTHCPRRLLLRDETSRRTRERARVRESKRGGGNEREGESERKRERSEGERKRENETERQSSSQPGGGQTGRLRAFSFRLSPFSLLPPFAFASFSCCFPSRAGPAVPRTAPRRAVPSQNHLCAWPKPPAVGLASGPLFSSPRSRSFFFLTSFSFIFSSCSCVPARVRARYFSLSLTHSPPHLGPT